MNKKIFIIHIVACLVLVLLSMIGLFFNNYELVTCVSIGSICSILYFFLLVKAGHMINPNDDISSKPLTFLLFTFLRFLVIILGFVITCLIIYLTDKDHDKYRYLNILGTALPYVCCSIILVMEKKDI